MGPSLITLRLSLLPACPSLGQVCVHPSCSPRQHGSSVLSRRPPARWNTAMRATYVALLHGSSLRIELCCLDPSTLNRPDPPHSRAHRNFTSSAYMRCLRCAGTPRRPASGSGLLLRIPSWHAILYDPGDFDIHKFQSRDVDIGLRRLLNGSALPKIPQLRFTRDTQCRGFLVYSFATACQVARRPVRI